MLSMTGFTLAEGATHVAMFDKMRRTAFTLAEVLITLAIIGVVATLTIPALVAHYQEKAWNTSSNVFNRKLGEALKIMNAEGRLSGYRSTKEFVGELSKHIKITKVCEELTECFPPTIYAGVDQEEVDISKLKRSENLNKASDYNTETIAVQFANGINALIAYNPNCTQDPYSNKVVNITGNKNSIGIGTDAISILYDVSGYAKPNQFNGAKDIRGINVALNIGGCSGFEFNGICAAASDIEYSCTGDIDYGNGVHETDCYEKAQQACSSIGMRLPNLAESIVMAHYSDKFGNPATFSSALCDGLDVLECHGISSSEFDEFNESIGIVMDVVADWERSLYGLAYDSGQSTIRCVQ